MASEFSSIEVTDYVRVAAPDSDPTSLVRNQEFSEAIDPLQAAVHAAAAVLNQDWSITVTVNGQQFTLALNVVTSANVAAGQGLLGVGQNGVYVVLGTGANQAAAGNHTHPDATEQTDGFMAAADKQKLDGIEDGATAIELAGSGTADTAAHSDHTHPDATEETDGFMAAADKAKLDALPTADEITANVVSAVAAALQDTATVAHLFTGGMISFNVVLATTLASGEGLIVNAQAGGLAVSVGPGANQAAAGNHTHPDATESQPGFMSAADKEKLDTLTSTYWRDPVPDAGDLPLNTDPVGAIRLVTAENTIYECISQTGLLSDQWEPFATIAAIATVAAAVAGMDNSILMSPLRTMQLITALALAPLASPALTGTPTAPTPAPGDNSTTLATTAFVSAAIDALVAGAPGALDTLRELADALGDNANFATSLANALAAKAPMASPALTGVPTAPTPAAGDNSTKLATTAFVQAALGGVRANLSWLVKNSNYAASPGDQVAADTSEGSFTVTLPSSPGLGAYVGICDAQSTWATNPLTVVAPGSNIMGNGNLVCNVAGGSFGLVYVGGAIGWKIIYNTSSPVFVPSASDSGSSGSGYSSGNPVGGDGFMGDDGYSYGYSSGNPVGGDGFLGDDGYSYSYSSGNPVGGDGFLGDDGGGGGPVGGDGFIGDDGGDSGDSGDDDGTPINITPPEIIYGYLPGGYNAYVGQPENVNSIGVWTNNPSGFTYQWQVLPNLTSDYSDIPGATGPSYTIDPSYLGQYIQCQITATNPVGSGVATSNQILIQNPPSQ